MVTRLLTLCGLDLGPAVDLLPPRPDNEEGFYENRFFVAASDRLLTALDAAWDVPPPAAPSATQAVADAVAEARALVEGFDARAPWGWKDPRVALLLPYWREVIPELRVLVCVRHPTDVTRSLTARHKGLSETFGLRLWNAYATHALADVPADARVVTHYDAYFHDPAGELTRVVAALGMDVSAETIATAVGIVADPLRHHTGVVEVPPAVAATYAALCAQAGPVHAAAQAAPRIDTPLPPRPPRILVDWLQQRLEAAEATVRASDADIGGLRTVLAAREADILALQAESTRAHDTIAALQHEIDQLRQALEASDATRAALAARLDALASHPLWGRLLRRRLGANGADT